MSGFDSPTPVGSSISGAGGVLGLTTAHFPSGDSATPVPSLSRIAGEPSVFRRNTAYFGPPPSPLSVNSMVLPSAYKSPGVDQSSHDKSRSFGAPGASPIIPARSLPRVSSTFPSRPTSRMVSSPGTRASNLSLPDRSTAYSERSPPVRVAVNHTSSPPGAQANP